MGALLGLTARASRGLVGIGTFIAGYFSNDVVAGVGDGVESAITTAKVVGAGAVIIIAFLIYKRIVR